MNKIDMNDPCWDCYKSSDWASGSRDRDIAKCLNGIVDYLENDLKKEIKEMAVREINNRFEMLDL